MNRRAFLSKMIGGVSAAAAVRTWPFRVFSFPSEVKIAASLDLAFEAYNFAGIPWIVDKYAPTNAYFMLNSKFLESTPVSNRSMRIPLALLGSTDFVKGHIEGLKV